MNEFLNDPGFDKKTYDQYITRIHYDNRDAANYENMLQFLWGYIIRQDGPEDRNGLLEEYTHWNAQLTTKCYYHMPHDLPYANLRRAYQSVVLLLLGEWEEGLSELDEIGAEAFSHDGMAPKVCMTGDGKVYRPMSRLFLVYNYARFFQSRGLLTELDELKEKFPFAFREFNDVEHEEHDAFLHSQMDPEIEGIVYPVFDRIYKLRSGPAEFYVYYEEGKTLAFPGREEDRE